MRVTERRIYQIQKQYQETGQIPELKLAFMGDSSRLITCYGVFDNATTANTIKVLKEGFKEYSKPDEILIDLEQFVAAKNRDKAKHSFKEFLEKNGVRHVLATEINSGYPQWQKCKVFIKNLGIQLETSG
jgi:hypothetical protein